MTTLQAVAVIAVMALVTFLTRVLPFLLFGRGGNPPRIILYLGNSGQRRKVPKEERAAAMFATMGDE